MDKKERLNAAYDYLRFRHVISGQADVAEAMGTTRPNVSSALNGRSSVLTDSFLSRFCDSFDGYINRRWLLFGEGDMIKKEEPSAPAKGPSESIIDLAATLIKEVESLRLELNEELAATRSIRAELASSCSQLADACSELTQLAASMKQASAYYGMIAAENLSTHKEKV